MRAALGAQPVEVSGKEGGNFDTGNIRQHHPRVVFIAVGHSYASLFGLLVDIDAKWRLIF
ncbi:hypothetical protein D3C87_1746940 [compost metagenome]